MSLLTHWEGEPVGVWSGMWGLPRLDVHGVVGSTNDEMRHLAGTTRLPTLTVVMAEEQTAGRGRSGAAWVAPVGTALLASIFVRIQAGAPPLHLPLAVGVAVARALEGAAPGVVAGIKWPNDVEIAGRKVAGILCESAPGGVVVGIGINVRDAGAALPEAVRERAVSLEGAAGTPVARSSVMGRLLAELRPVLVEADGGAGLPEDLLAELQRRDVLAGRAVQTRTGRGTARGIAADGALLVDLGEQGATRVVAGSVRLA
ncbi:MAG: biotin--[acetyl-CoA-carboxylase] ligase [Longimicrobiales bacterium]